MIQQKRDGNLIRFIGKDKSFTAVWNFTEQMYTVYKDGKKLITSYCFAEVKNYLV